MAGNIPVALPCTHDHEGPDQELQNAEGPVVPVYTDEPVHWRHQHGQIEHPRGAYAVLARCYQAEHVRPAPDPLREARRPLLTA